MDFPGGPVVIYLRLHAPNAGDPGLTPTQGARFHRASLVAQTAQNLPAVQETQVQSLDREDPWEKEMATHSSTLAWRTPWTEEPGRLQSMGSQRVKHD